MNDEKKKLAIVGALVAVMACVGAFQLLGGKKAPPPAPAETTSKPTIVATKVGNKKPGPGATTPDGAPAAALNPQVANDLPVRDPFKPPPGALPPSPSGPGPIPPRFHPLMGGPRPITPPGLSGLQPGGAIGAVSGGSLRPIAPVVEHPFSFRLVGEIGGDHPAALFEDATGNQKLVAVGSKVDSDTTLQSIGRESVIIAFRSGKKLRVSMGGNPVGK